MIRRTEILKAVWAGLFVLLLAGCATVPPVPVSEQEISVGDGVVLAGLIDESAVGYLQRSNAVVVDLRTEPEGAPEEAAAMQEAGVKYYNFPIGRSGLTDDARRGLDEVLNDHAGRPIVIHCRSGNRAGLLWAAHLMDEGASAEEALTVVDGIVTVDGIRTAIRDYEASSDSE